MSSDDKEGAYCGICGGISPGKITVRQIHIKRKPVGIDCLDEIIKTVRDMNLSDDDLIIKELVKLVKKNNYIPSSRIKEYGESLLEEYKKEI